jgi:hypothetical protein
MMDSVGVTVECRERRNERGRAGGGWLGDYIAAARAQNFMVCVDGRGCEFCRCDPGKLVGLVGVTIHDELAGARSAFHNP